MVNPEKRELHERGKAPGTGTLRNRLRKKEDRELGCFAFGEGEFPARRRPDSRPKVSHGVTAILAAMAVMAAGPSRPSVF